MPQQVKSRTPKIAAIINDNILQQKFLSLRLSKHNFECRLYNGAEEALSGMKTLPAPDIIISDLYMPGIDGWKFCRLLRSEEYPMFNTTPLLVISATFSGEDAECITSNTGADAFLPTPVDEAVLIRVVNQLIDGRNTTSINKSKVLLVEDSRALGNVLRKAFISRGYHTELVGTLSEAKVEMASNRHSIAIIDYHLPDGKGDELIPFAKDVWPDCVCIMITGDSSPDLAVKWLRGGAAAYLRKPFHVDYLMELCLKACRERSFLRVEMLLEQRTLQLHKEEIKNRQMVEKREALLKQKSEERRLLLDTIPQQVWYLSDPETYGPVNKTFADFFGLHPKQLAYQKLHQHLSPEVYNNHIATNKTIFQTGTPISQEEWLTNSKGEKRLISIIKTPKLNDAGQVEFVVCSGTDITNQKKAMEDRLELEKAALHIEKRDSLQQMAGAVAHNFNNILSGVMGYLELALLEKSLLPSQVVKHLNASMDAAKRATELSRLMLIFLGQTEGKKEKLDLVDFCRESHSLIDSNKPENISLEMALSSEPLFVNADSKQLLMALMNLATNAWESMENRKGKLSVSMGTIACGKIRESYVYPPDWDCNADQYAFLEIEDSGCGMSTEALSRIFDPFFSTKFSGRGVGLSVVAGIAKAHNGSVSVSSNNAGGSKFRLYLPLYGTTRQIVCTPSKL